MKSVGAAAFFACTVLAAGSDAFDTSLLPWESDELPTRSEEFTTYEIPIGPYVDGDIRFVVVEGSLEQSVVRIGGSRSTLELLSEFRDALNQTSHRVIFQCYTKSCGGFDFRLNIDVATAPDMFVDLGDFRFLSAMRVVGGGTEYVTLLVSRTKTIGFAQISKVTTTEKLRTSVLPPADGDKSGSASDSLVESLQKNGFAVFEMLEFESGSTSLGNVSMPELQDLARYLKKNSNLKVILVGHTDAKGSLEANVELSTKRAESVQKQLIEVHGVDPEQLLAEGVGFLAPRATNATAEGREKNRRVEVVVLNGN